MFMQFLLEILCLCNFWASKNYPAIIRRLVLPHLLIKRKEFDVDATVGLVDGRRVPVHLSWRDWGWLGGKLSSDKPLKDQTYPAGLLDSLEGFQFTWDWFEEMDFERVKHNTITQRCFFFHKSGSRCANLNTLIIFGSVASLSETAWKIFIRNSLKNRYQKRLGNFIRHRLENTLPFHSSWESPLSWSSPRSSRPHWNCKFTVILKNTWYL